MYDGLRQLVRAYQQQGPLFRQKIAGRQLLVLAGPPANVFLATAGDRFFSSRPVFTSLGRELGTDDFILAMDGTPHRTMRSIMKPGFTREAIARAVPLMVDTTRRMVRTWRRGERVQMVQAFRRMITDQLGLSMMHRAAGPDFDAVSEFFDTAIGGKSAGTRPPDALKSPTYLAARNRVFTIVRDIVAERRATGPRPEPDFIDHLLAGKTETGQPLGEEVLLTAALVPFFAGIGTVANTCAFMLYVLLKDPGLLRRVTAEADALFATDDLDAESLTRMRVLYGTTMETLRMYPVATSAMRYITEPFEFAGEWVAAGQMVVLATPVAHFLPELWPNPETFDPERYWEPRNEHRQPGAFAPYFKGPHTCLGAALGEMQIMVTMATLLHYARLALDPPTYEMQFTFDPLLTPRGGYYVSVQQTYAV